uniref:FHA domain-containing protein n=1 Tax=Denticeps clupeoides TaxID=299321 RepID=A0AAY4DLI2_9TELE
MSLTSWFLVSSGGTRHRLPREMIFVGRDDCELMLQSRSVDKQHAVINYESTSDEHKVKDLGSLNGTFVNDVRIQEQMYITLKIDDKLRFGYDILFDHEGELHVPEEALKHEKFTSQLQFSKKPHNGDAAKPLKSPSSKTAAKKGAEPTIEGQTKPADVQKGEEKMPGDITSVHRGTPLYGQPSWWGDGDADDENSFKQETKPSGKKQEACGTDRGDRSKENGLGPLSSESTYMELPSKEGQMANSSIHEIPTKDTEGETTAAGTAAQGHASFTIEFDSTSPGKVTIKDHVSKFSADQRPRPKKSGQAGGKDLSNLQAAMIASESKVADWLAQNDPTLVRRVSTEEDSRSIKSDVPVHLKRLKGSKHEDGTQSDSENGLALRFGGRRQALEERLRAAAGGRVKVVATAANESKRTASPLATAAPAAAQPQHQQKPDEPGLTEDKQEDDQSDKGTYTIELENHNPEEEEARRMIDKILADESVAVGSTSWVSQWAGVASNHMRTDPEGSGAEPPPFVHQERGRSESFLVLTSSATATSSSTERKRRTLPQLPIEEKAKLGKGSTSLGPSSGIGEKQDTEPQEKENHTDHKGDGECLPPIKTDEIMTSKQVPSNTLQQEGNSTQKSWSPSKPPIRPAGSEKRVDDSRKRRPEEKSKSEDGAEKSGRPLVRQGSFTIEKPSSNVPVELIPRINKQMAESRQRRDSTGSMDTATLLKDTEAVMAFLEAKLRGENKLDRGIESSAPPRPPTGSISPESDIDTTSQASQAAGESDRKAVVKRRSLSSLHREKSNASSTAKAAAGTRDRLERKAKARVSETRPDARRAAQAGASRVRQASLDLTDDDQTSSLQLSTMSDVLSSDQETYSGRSNGRGHFTSTDDLLQSKMKTCKSSKASQPTATALGKQPTLPQPRPTRASLLRRARLGDTSDTDLADADRVSVASEVSTTSSTSKPPSGRKIPSRIDMLAQPRRTRLGSISARSDSEATVSRTAATRLSAETALRLGLRSATPPDGKITARARANSISKLNDHRAKSSTPISNSPAVVTNRWRRLPPEYASTSEDEFGSNLNSPKHGRLRTGTVARGTRVGGSAPATPGPAGIMLKHRMKEQEEYIRDWTAHSEEIARYSSDLAILAREIHDVAGEIDSVSSSGTAPSTTVSTAATTPGSAIDTREELVDRVFDESLNFRKIPPVVQTKAPEINGRPVELRNRVPDSLDPQAALRRRTWNRDEAVLDSLLLTSVVQLSSKIRQSVDKTAGKIRILFKDKDRNWEDIESNLRAESDIPLLKTSNKEISSILLELKRVEKQLQVINAMVDPDGTLDALTSLGLASPVLSKPRTSPGSQTPQGPLPGPGATKTPSAVLSPGDGQRELGLSFSRTHPSGQESSVTSK